MRHRSPISTSFLVALATAACGLSDGPTSPPTQQPPENQPPPRVVTTIQITVSTTTPTEGDPVTYSVVVKDQDGGGMSANGLIWRVDDNGVAGFDLNGRLTMIREGTVELTATLASVADTVVLTVLPYPDPPAVLALGDSMAGYVPPGVTDTIPLEVPDDVAVQFRGTAIEYSTFLSLLNPDGGSRGMLEIQTGTTWYSAVYLGGIGSMLAGLSNAGIGLHYTLVADSIHMAPEVASASVALGDTVRGEAIRNGDRDVFTVAGGAGQEEVFVLLGPEWEGRTLTVRRFSGGIPLWGANVDQADSTWISLGVTDFSTAGDELQFHASQPWGREWDGTFEFVVRPSGG